MEIRRTPACLQQDAVETVIDRSTQPAPPKPLWQSMMASPVAAASLHNLSSLSKRIIKYINPHTYLMKVEAFNRSLEKVGAKIYARYTDGQGFKRLHPRTLFDFTTVLSIKAVTGVGRAFINEVLSWADFTNVADHMGLMNSNPIPGYYYTMGDCYRYSCCYLGSEKVQPYTSVDDIIAIKGRFAILSFLYKMAGIH